MTDKPDGFNKGGMVTQGDDRHACHGNTGWPGPRGTTSPTTSWTDDAMTELLRLSMNLHNLSFEVAQIRDIDRPRPCLSEILKGYATRIDELMKRAPEAVS